MYKLIPIFENKFRKYDQSEFKMQYVGESDSFYKYPNSQENPSDLIDNLGAPCHLYIVSDEEPKIGDAYVAKVFGKYQYDIWDATCDQQKTNNEFGYIYSTVKKVIKTTNTNLNMPLISDNFLQTIQGKEVKNIAEELLIFEIS